MKKNLLLILLIALSYTTIAQFVEVSYGTSYSQQTYYTFSDDAKTIIPNTAWDIAFSCIGDEDAGVHINEATQSMGTELELYEAPSNSFDDVINPDDLMTRLFNPEQSWYFGAFNSQRDIEEPTDFGWGLYDPDDNYALGTKVYALKLRDGTFKKLKIETLESNTYTVRIADLDGANESTLMVDKGSFPASNFAYYSFDTGGFVDGIPADFDLLFTRYVYPLDDGSGGFLQYLLTGVLSGMGVEVAQADGVDPQTVAFEDYLGFLDADLTIIGHDWKDFELSTFMWTVPADRAYFVKTGDGHLWKVVFVDFEGSSTGNAVFEKTDLGIVSSVDDVNFLNSFDVFPNPMISEATIAFSLENTENVRFSLTDLSGRELWQSSVQGQSGLNVHTLPELGLTQGAYFLSLQAKGEIVTKKLIRH
jgi:hypothetical protein